MKYFAKDNRQYVKQLTKDNRQLHTLQKTISNMLFTRISNMYTHLQWISVQQSSKPKRIITDAGNQIWDLGPLTQNSYALTTTSVLQICSHAGHSKICSSPETHTYLHTISTFETIEFPLPYRYPPLLRKSLNKYMHNCEQILKQSTFKYCTYSAQDIVTNLRAIQ